MNIFHRYVSGVDFWFFLDITIPFVEKRNGMQFNSRWFLLVVVYLCDIFDCALYIFLMPPFML